MPLAVKIILTTMIIILIAGIIYIQTGWRWARYIVVGTLGFTIGMILTFIWSL